MECRSPEWSVQFRKIPPARLAAVGKKLDTMLQAVKLARSALDDFYATLSDEQKFQFEAIDPRRSSDQPQTTRRRRGREVFGNSIGGLTEVERELIRTRHGARRNTRR